MYLGLDLGTSGLRGLLVSPDGAPIGEASSEYEIKAPHSGWSEQDPADWIDALKNVIANLRQRLPVEVAEIQGVGVAGQMHGATCIDAAGDPVRPCILWNDTRSAAEAAVLDQNPKFRKISGNIVFPGFTAPKLLWMRNHEPEAFARVATTLLPKDFLVYWLTGQRASEMSDAAGTSWLDTGKRAWSETLIEASGMRPGQMPRLFEGSEVVGEVLSERASDLGLPAGVRVVAGAGDNAAAACGMGALNEGQAFVSLGTSGVLLAARDHYSPAPDTAVHSFCHAVPDRWYQMGVILAATDSLNWLAQLVGEKPAALASALPERTAGPAPVRFLPYIAGERTPHNEARPCGAFLGLSKATDALVLTQAVMEGVAFALRDCLEALRSTGARLEALTAIGGGARSRFWLDALANSLNLPIWSPEKGEFGAALGAARLAMIGVGGMAVEDVITPPRIKCVIEPDPRIQSEYEAAYASFAKAFDAIKEFS